MPVTDLRVADGAPIARRLLHWAGGSRRQVLQGSTVRWDLGLGRYLAAALHQALAFCAVATIVLFGWKALIDTFRAGTDPEARRLVELVTARGGRLLFGHYGAARGRDDWKDADVLISVGDPRPSLAASRAVAAVLGLSADHATVYRRATAADGTMVADLVDPHGHHLADALPKLRGLARYAETHAGAYRRIESVAEGYGKLRMLNLKDAAVRQAIAAAEDAASLFKGLLATDY